MKCNNFDLISISNVLNAYADKKLPQKISYAITRNIMNLSEDLECYSRELNKIIDTYKEHQKNENGEAMMSPIGVPLVEDEYTEEYMGAISALLNIEVDVSLYTIDEDEFDYDGERFDPLSASDIMKLTKILCYKEKEDA